MKTAYELTVSVNDKPVQFVMKVDNSLKPATKIDEKCADKWRNRLQAIANSLFIKES